MRFPIANRFYLAMEKTFMRIMTLAFLSFLMATPTFADPCLSYITPLFEGVNGMPAPASVTVRGTRLSARGANGFTSAAAASDYRTNMSQADKAARDSFVIALNQGETALEGTFQDVFPGRPDAAIDLTTLKVSRNGRVEIILNRWGNAVIQLGNVQCYPGHQGAAFVMNGRARDAGYGLDMWTFVLSPYFIN